MYVFWSDIYSSFLFHCWELLTHVHLMELFSIELCYQFIPTPPVIYAHHQGHSTFFLVEMFEVDRRNGRGYLYFGVVVVLRSPIHANEPSEYNGMLYRTSNRVLNNGIKVIILICMDGTSQYHHYLFRGGYHPRKTSCESTVGANRLAGPIISWTDHYLYFRQ